MALITEHLDADAAGWLGQRCRVVSCAVTDAGFAAALAQAEALVIRTYTVVDGAMLAGAPRLKVVGRAGVGLDNIDVAACRARGIEVVYTPDANTQAVVEYVVALMLDALRPRITINRAIDQREWNRIRANTLGQRQLGELTIGLLGLGRVGQGVARVMAALGARVLYNDLVRIDPEQRWGAQPASVEELFASADVLSIHVDGRESNRGFVSTGMMARMKPEVLVVNTARGFVVDNWALAEFMRNNSRAMAMLDVHEPEPFGADYSMLGLPNVRLYPHLASRTATAMRNMSAVVHDVWAVLEGRVPCFPAPRSGER
jgi:phosphoglycerate dehydrogenase-like enzyme